MRRASLLNWFRRHRFPILVAALGCIVFLRCSCEATWFLPFGAMDAKYDKLRYGMTKQEVIEILGEPSSHNDLGQDIWVGEGGIIIISYEYGRVSGKAFAPNNWRPPPPPLGP